MEEFMKKTIISIMIMLASAFCVTVFAAEPGYGADSNYGPSEESDFITGDSVEGKDTNGLMDGSLVDAIATKTPYPTPEPEPTLAPPVKEPTPKPQPTAIPTPKPRPTPKKAAPRPTPVPPTPVPTRAPAAFPGLEVSKAAITETVMKRTAENFFGLLTAERKFTLSLVLENKGATGSYYTIANLKSGDTSVLTSDPEKNLGTVLPGSRLDLVYSLVVLGSYDGDLKLPLSLKVTANGLVKEFPFDAYIDESVPYLLYIGAGLLILLILLLLLMLLRGGKKGQAKKGKDYDFDV
jgi:hypothetical protein